MYALGRVAGLEGPVLVYNRTAERAWALAAEFGGEAVTDLAAVVRAALRAMACVHSRSRRELVVGQKDLFVSGLSSPSLLPST